MDKKPRCIFCGSTENLSPAEPVDYENPNVYICQDCRTSNRPLDLLKSAQQPEPPEAQREDWEDHENPKP